MKSIRFYLITTILAAMTLLIFLSALQGYNKSTKEAKNLLDKQLIDMASILSVMQIEPESRQSIVTNIETSNTAFQIWHNQQLVSRSNNAPEQLMTSLCEVFRIVILRTIVGEIMCISMLRQNVGLLPQNGLMYEIV